MIFSTFICEDIDDGQSYLRADYAINCASTEHIVAMAYASVMLLIFPLGVPLLYTWIMYNKRSFLEVQEGKTRVVLAKQEQRLARAAERARGLGPRLRQGCVHLELRPGLVQERPRRHSPRKLHLVVHPGCFAWYENAHQALPSGRLWPRSISRSSRVGVCGLLDRPELNGKEGFVLLTEGIIWTVRLDDGTEMALPEANLEARSDQLVINGLARQRHSTACNFELRLSVERPLRAPLQLPAWLRRSNQAAAPRKPRVGVGTRRGRDPLAVWHDALEPQIAISRSFLVARAWQRLVEGKLADDWTRLLRMCDALPHVPYQTAQPVELRDSPGSFVQQLTLLSLPTYFGQVIGPYELRVYWFEVFECARKLAIVGLPLFIMPGTLEQLVIGLCVCFVSLGVHVLLNPYLQLRDDYVSRICQAQIFFALVVGVVLKTEPTQRTVDTFGYVLTLVCVAPPACVIFLALPCSKYLVDATPREEVLRALVKMWKKLRSRRVKRSAKAVAPEKNRGMSLRSLSRSLSPNRLHGPPQLQTRRTSLWETMRVATRSGEATGICPACSGWLGRAKGKPPECSNPDCPGCTISPRPADGLGAAGRNLFGANRRGSFGKSMMSILESAKSCAQLPRIQLGGGAVPPQSIRTRDPPACTRLSCLSALRRSTLQPRNFSSATADRKNNRHLCEETTAGSACTMSTLSQLTTETMPETTMEARTRADRSHATVVTCIVPVTTVVLRCSTRRRARHCTRRRHAAGC